jgi:hypothetical protein
MRLGVAVILLAALSGCSRDEPAPPVPAKPPPVPVEIVTAPAEGEVAAIVQREFARAGDQGRTLLVYVGATWCEPCKRFHDAAAAGQLDATFPGLRLVEFDLDRDRDRLQQAGYASKMIPLFALPRADGTGSGEQIEGSIKGEGAVNQIAPRLGALLAKAKR